MNRKVVEIGGRRLSLANLDKDLYPSYGFTKAHILEYYSHISTFILPHLRDRAITLKRYPEGVDKEYFFEKRCPAHHPEWIKTAEILRDNEASMTYCMVNDLESLIWVENLASIELHVPLCRAASPEIADSLVFDLDPGEEADIIDCARVALILRDLLDGLKLRGRVKTSGKKGLHLYVPLNNRKSTFDDTKTFSKAVADILQKNYPDLVTARMAKEYRTRKVFINWSQNDSSKTMIGVYSLRARERPIVSFPVEWREIEAAIEQKEADMLIIDHSEALKRVEKKGDLFAELLNRKQRLPHL